MDQTNQQEGKAKQFTRDDVARMVVITLDQVLEAVHVQQIVEGIAVLPAGEDVYLVDIVMRDLSTKETWGVSITIPPPQEVTNDATYDIVIDWTKQFAVVSINRADLTEFSFTDEQITAIFTDEVMFQIAEKMQESYFLTSSYFFWDDFKKAISAFTTVTHERKP